jgi:uncharacterized protein (TIRG00374 family)
VVEIQPDHVATKHFASRAAGTFLRWAVAAGAICFLIRGVRWSDVGLYLRHVRPVLLISVIGLNAILMGIKALRLRLLLAPRNAPGISCFLALLTSSAINNVVPLRGGDVARLWMLQRSAGVTKAAAVAVGVVERLIDIGALALLAVPASRIAPTQEWAFVASLVVLAATVGLLWTLRRLIKASRQDGSRAGFSLRRSGWRSIFSSLRDRLADGVTVLESFASLATTIGLSVAAWICETVMVMTCAKAMGIDIPVPLAIVTLLGINLALALPSTPSNAGPFEAAIVVVLSVAGYSKPQALAFALIYHLIQVVPVTVSGLVVAAHNNSGLSSRRGSSPVVRTHRLEAVRAELPLHELPADDAPRA